VVTLNLSAELQEILRKRAEAEQVSLDELVESMLTQYIEIEEEDDEPSPEELAGLDEAITEYEAKKAAGIPLLTTEQVLQNISEFIANHKNTDQKASA
jgi:hypothetical protein